jgi:hypothetical protein
VSLKTRLQKLEARLGPSDPSGLDGDEDMRCIMVARIFDALRRRRERNQ